MKRAVAGFLATLVAVVAGCAPASAPDATNASNRVTVAVVPYLTLAPLFVAQEEGYFGEAGLDVEFVRMTRNQDLMTALATGEIDASGGMLTVNEMALAMNGARIRMIAALGAFGSDCTLGAIVARRELLESGALRDPERLRELTIDTSEMVPFDYWVDLHLESLGMTSAELRRTDLPSTASVPALIEGNLDLTIETEPFLSTLIDSGRAGVWAPIEQLAPGYVLTMVMFGPRLLDDRPDLGERFTIAVLRAIRQLRDGKTARNVEIISEQMGLEPDRVESLCWPDMPADGRIDPTVFRGYQRWSLEHGLIERTPADDELFDTRFIEYANAEIDR